MKNLLMMICLTGLTVGCSKSYDRTKAYERVCVGDHEYWRGTHSSIAPILTSEGKPIKCEEFE